MKRKLDDQPPPTNEAVRSRWDGFAALYDQNFHLWSGPAHLSGIAALSLPLLSKSDMVLEVATTPPCGACDGV